MIDKGIKEGLYRYSGRILEEGGLLGNGGMVSRG